MAEPDEPKYDPKELYEIVPGPNTRTP